MRLPAVDKKGFSLVEVMLAMVMLAIIAIPLLNSFVTSTKINFTSSQLQDANMLGQKTMEEIKSKPLEKVYQQYIDAAQGEVLNDANVAINKSGTVFSEKSSYRFCEKSLDGGNGKYDVWVQLDATKYATHYDPTVPSPTPTDGPNRFGIPQLIEVTSGNNIVMPELPSYELNAISSLISKWKTKTGVTKTNDQIKADVARDIFIKFSDPDLSDDKIKVTIEYVYTYTNGASTVQDSQAVYSSTTVQKSSAGIYLFYTALPNRKDTVKFEDLQNVSVAGSLFKFDLYIIEQGTLPVGNMYKISMNSLGGSGQIPTIINKVRTNVDFYPVTGDIAKGLIETKQKNRLYEMTVRVYKASSATPTFNSKDLISEFKSTKEE